MPHVLSEQARDTKVYVHYDPNYVKNEHICIRGKGQNVNSGQLWEV